MQLRAISKDNIVPLNCPPGGTGQDEEGAGRASRDRLPGVQGILRQREPGDGGAGAGAAGVLQAPRGQQAGAVGLPAAALGPRLPRDRAGREDAGRLAAQGPEEEGRAKQ